MRIGRRNLAAAGTVTATSTHSSDYAAAYLVDGDPTRPWIAAEGASAVALRVDLDALLGVGGFEAAALPGTDESTGAGSIDIEGSITHAGDQALKMLAGAGGVGRWSGTVTARPGEAWNLSVYLRGDGTGSARLRIEDTVTGQWYVGGAWQASEADYAARSATSYAETEVSFTVSDEDEHQLEEIPIRIHLLCSDSGQVAYADELAAWPSWDTVAIVGHNVRPRQGVTVYSVTGASWGSGTLLGTLTKPQRPACYYRHASQVATRYLEVIFPGVAEEQLYAGELHVAQSLELARSFGTSHQRGAALPQVAMEAAAGRRHITAYTTDPIRTLELTFFATDSDEAEELQAQLFWACRQGADAFLAIPDDDRPDVYLVRVIEPLESTVRRLRTGDGHTFRVRLAEDGFPTVGL